MKNLIVKSPAFENKEHMPTKYTCDGDEINLSLTIEGASKGKSLLLIIDDPDAATGMWNYWLVLNIPPTRKIKENSIPRTQVVNTAGKRACGGPSPPSGTQRYFFKVYALDIKLNLNPNLRKENMEKAMQGHILAEASFSSIAESKRSPFLSWA